MQRILSLLMMLLLTIMAAAQSVVIIKGKVHGNTKGYNKVYIYGKNLQTDSALISNGEFLINCPYTDGVMPVLYTEYDLQVKKGMTPYPLVIDGPCTVTLEDIDIEKGMASAKLSGNRSAEEYLRFDQNIATVKGGAKEYAVFLNKYVKDHADVYAAAFVMLRYRSLLSADDMEALLGQLAPAVRETETGKAIAVYLEALKRSSMGATVNDFVLPTPGGQDFSFSRLRGKYVLIDFWASWCSPCKASFPHMKKLYEQLRGDRFEILSISIDKDKKAWLKELKQQKLPWLQLHDTADVAERNFAVAAVPTVFLVDPDGRLVMKETGFDKTGKGPIEKKLRALFPGKITPDTPSKKMK